MSVTKAYVRVLAGGLVLGLSALLVPIALDRATLRFDLPTMTMAALLLVLLSLDGGLRRG